MDGFALPVKKLKGTDPIETLDLSAKSLGVASAVVIASLIGVNGVLTECNVRGNNLDSESAKKLAMIGTKKGIMLFGIKRDQTTADFSQQSLYPSDAILLASDLSQAVVTGSLTALDLSSNYLKDEGVSAVCEAIQSNKETKLASLNFRNNGIGPVGANAVAAMVVVTGSLTALDLWYNNLKDEGVSAVCEAIQSNKETKLSSLNFGNNYIGPVGANAVAAMVVVTGSLTECDLSNNNMSKEGEALIRKAVEGKAGFKLHLNRDHQ